MLHFNWLSSLKHQEPSVPKEPSTIPLSSAEAYEWALENLNHDYQTLDNDKTDTLAEPFDKLDTLDFTFTTSYPIDLDPQNPSPTINELTAVANVPQTLTTLSHQLSDTFTSAYPHLNCASSDSTNSKKPRRYSYEPQETHSFSLNLSKHHLHFHLKPWGFKHHSNIKVS